MADLDNLLLLYRSGADVWCEHAEQVWLPANIVKIEGLPALLGTSPAHGACVITVNRRDDEAITMNIRTKNDLPPLQNPKVLSDVKDLTELTYLHEPAILENLRHRYVDNRDFYSYCGIILIAINPYCSIRQMYDNAAILSYRGQSLANVDPHVFGIAEAALVDLERENRSQTVVVSGESGAGKTISAKYVMGYLAEVSRSEASTSMSTSMSGVKEKTAGPQSASTEARVLATEPIFEAFGNAKTVRNNNSSRFGKLIRTEFAVSSLTSGRSTHARISGAKINTYLLEKSRVVGQASSERSFHVFYQLCAAVYRATVNSENQRSVAQEAAVAAATLRVQQQQAARDAELLSLGLGSARNYAYLRQSGCYDNADMNDCKGFDQLRDAFTTVGLRNTEQWVIFQVVAAILHLGNVVIEGDKDSSSMKANDASLVKACELLSIDAESLALACTRKRMLVSNEMMLKPIGVEAACASRDAMAKHMYACLFNWLVLKLRASLSGNSAASGDSEDAVQTLFIGILDIYGFETFQKNGFEQLCINFANEHLQQLYVRHVFKLEQSQYAAEKIEWTKVHFSDNTPTISLLEMHLGVFNLLDEECKVPNGSDKNWLTKMENRRNELCGTTFPHSSKNATLSRGGTRNVIDEKVSAEVSSYSRFQTGRGGNSFIIAHFAGKVEYSVSQFAEKNRDEINVDIVGCLQSSRNALIAEIYDIYDAVDENGQPLPNNNSLTRGGALPLNEAARTRVVAPYGDASGVASPRRRSALQMLAATKKRPTVSFQFRQSLQDLMKVLDSTTPHFIRCIKPNDEKKPFLLDNKRAIEQLRACGVLETCRIASAGFPTRWPFERFVERYRPLAAVAVLKKLTMSEKCQCILKAFKDVTGKTDAETFDDKYRIGVTKIFLRAHMVAVLERMRLDKLNTTADFWKRLLRGRRDRRRYLQLREATIRLQAGARGFLARKLRDSLLRTHAATTLQAHVRRYQAQKRYMRLRSIVIQLQAHVRGAAVRRYYANIQQNRAAVKIQAAWRGYQGRKLAEEKLKKIRIVQSCVRRYLARRRLKELKKEARNVTHLQSLSKGLENKLFKMQRHFDAREAEQRLEAERQAAEHRAEVERLRQENLNATALVAQQELRLRNQVVNEAEVLHARIKELEETLRAEQNEKTKLHRKLRRADKVQENVVTLQAKLARVEKQHEQELNALRRQAEDALQSRDETVHHIEHMGRRLLAMYEQLDEAAVENRMLTRQLLDEQAARTAATANNAGASTSAATSSTAKNSGYTSWFSLFSSSATRANRPESKQVHDAAATERENEAKTLRVDALLEETANLRSTISHLRAQLQTAQMYGTLVSTAETPLPSVRGVDGNNYDIDDNSTLPAGASATSARPVSNSKSKFAGQVYDQYDDDVPVYDDVIVEDVDGDAFVVVQPGGTVATTSNGRQSSSSGWSSPMAQWFSRDGTLMIPSALISAFCERFTQIDPFTLEYGNTMQLKNAGRGSRDAGNINALMLLPAGVQAYIVVMALRLYDKEHDEKGLLQFMSSYTNALCRTAAAYANHRNEDSSRLLQVIDYYTSWYAAQLKIIDLTHQLNITSVNEESGFAEHIQAQCFGKFDFSLQLQQFNAISSTLYGKLCTFMQEALRPYIVGALIQYNPTALPMPDYTPKKADRRQQLMNGESSTIRRAGESGTQRGQLDPSEAFELFREYLNIFYDTLTRTYRLPAAAISNIFRQLMFFTSSIVLNLLMISTKYCGFSYGINMQLNICALSDWLKNRPALAVEVLAHNAEYKKQTDSGSMPSPGLRSATPVGQRTDSCVSDASSSSTVLYENLRTPTTPNGKRNSGTISVASSSVMTVREFAAAHDASTALMPLIEACTLIIMQKSRNDLSDKLLDWSHLNIAQIERILMNCNVEQFSHGDEKSKVVEYVRQRLTEMEAQGKRTYVKPRFLLNGGDAGNYSGTKGNGEAVDGLTLLIDTSRILATANTLMSAGSNISTEPMDLLSVDLPSEYLHAICVRKL